MTDFSADKLRALDEAASNARPDGDGDFSSYIKAEGALSRYLKEYIPAILALADREKRMREALARAGMRFDMLAPLVIEGNSKLAVTKWANEARAAALGEEKA